MLRAWLHSQDQGNHRLRKVDPAGIITTIAGTGVPGSSGDGSAAVDALIDRPHAIAIDATGNIYFTDWQYNSVRRIDPAGIITTVAGTGISTAGFSEDCGPALDAQLSHPEGLAVGNGVLYILDTGNNRVRMLVP